MLPQRKRDAEGNDEKTGGVLPSAGRASVETTVVVLSWFVLNIMIGSSTKWIYLYGVICIEAEPRECHPFKFPLTITFIHMVFSWGMCYIQLNYISTKARARYLTFQEQLEKIAPLSLCTALSIAMGNLSLKYIFPSFNQMLGSMSPLITVALAVCWQGKRFSWWTWGAMPLICGGLALCSLGEVNFSIYGAFHATGATVLRSVKSIISGKLLQGEKIDSVSLLYYMAPWAAVLLLLLAIASEGFEPLWLLIHGLRGTAPGPTGLGETVTGGAMVVGLLVCSGLNACLLNVANFGVTSYTGPVTLQVLGNVKSCLAIGVSVAIFRNELQFQQGIGVAACLFGVWVYQRRGGEVKAGAASSTSSAAAAAPAASEASGAKPAAAPAATKRAEEVELTGAEATSKGGGADSDSDL